MFAGDVSKSYLDLLRMCIYLFTGAKQNEMNRFILDT